MKLKGIIKEMAVSLDKNNQPRVWTNPEGVVYEFFIAKIDIPHVGNNGQTYYDTILADVSREKCVGSQPLPYENYMNTEKPLEVTLTSCVREYNGRQFLSIKLSNVTIQAE